MHVDADDQSLALWPDDRDAVGILAYARTHHGALPPATYENKRRGEHAGLRLTLIRHLRELLDREELAALEDARTGGLTWQAIAELLGVEYPGSASNRLDRLRAAAADPAGVRTPAAGRRAVAAEQAAADRERRAALAVTRRHRQVRTVTLALLQQANDLALTEDAEEWLRAAREILDEETPTPTQQQSLAAYVSLAAAEISLHASVEEIAPARTEEAMVALEAARNL
ncbi:hypothetical protein HS048_34485 [Planomonospora sp. ID91781]|uniref:hypothetical protein n=1 Tax=Planomonospora sp. ID91781 TaxID=2738135 RepID=UPI0018C41CA4|nr:hypothetical protein [Planomonospora sp. ID91781]MBG0825793.1 hypothetical protein [Planomonospora sp. ID91781]